MDLHQLESEMDVQSHHGHMSQSQLNGAVTDFTVSGCEYRYPSVLAMLVLLPVLGVVLGVPSTGSGE
jgi:hypothetical protein